MAHRQQRAARPRRAAAAPILRPKEGEPPLLIVAPRALHDAGFLDLAPGHSLVETLKSNGCDRVFLIEWKRATASMRDQGIDAQLALLNVAIDEIGAPADLVGVCQGGWLSLVYAARFPGKVRKLVLAGAPVDTQAAPSSIDGPGSPLNEAIQEELLRLGDGLRARTTSVAALAPRTDEGPRRRGLSCRLPRSQRRRKSCGSPRYSSVGIIACSICRGRITERSRLGSIARTG